MKRLTMSIVTVAALAFLVSCRARRELHPHTRPNIVLITIDTLRADRIGRGFTPAIDALASAGVRFDNARSAVPLTLPSHVTIMTGVLPVAHGIRENGVVFAPRPSAVPLARVLKDAGYQTSGFVGAYVLDRRFGLADGFDTYDDRIRRNPDEGARLEAERQGGEVIDAAVAWLNTQTDAPFFLWVHLYDPHAPYEPPRGVRDQSRWQSLRWGSGVCGRAGRSARRGAPRARADERRRSSPSLATMARASASTASRRTACSRTTRR